jgi:hypothetical protein
MGNKTLSKNWMLPPVLYLFPPATLLRKWAKALFYSSPQRRGINPSLSPPTKRGVKKKSEEKYHF